LAISNMRKMGVTAPNFMACSSEIGATAPWTPEG
jgi:hypothetical protein